MSLGAEGWWSRVFLSATGDTSAVASTILHGCYNLNQPLVLLKLPHFTCIQSFILVNLYEAIASYEKFRRAYSLEDSLLGNESWLKDLRKLMTLN